MKRILVLIVIGIVLWSGKSCECRAAEVGENISVDGVNYEITDTSPNNTVAVIGFQVNENSDNSKQVIIPEGITYNGTKYTVDELRLPYNSLSLFNKSTLDIPETITKSNVKWLNITGGKVDITFRCPAEVLKDIDIIEVNSTAIESIIFVPEEYLDDYKSFFNDKTRCVFYDNDIEPRSYTGIPIYSIGTLDVLPAGFYYNDSYYKILNSKKKTVSLICSYALKKKGIAGICYKQPAKVYYNGQKYKVTKIEYYAFCNVRAGESIELKLPETVSSIESKSIGWNIKKLDLSDTKIKEIPKYLINSVYDEYDEPAVIEEVILPGTCRKLLKYAFYNCKNLKGIKLPAGFKNIGKKAFSSKVRNFKIYIEGETIPSGLEIQNMKSVIIYVNDELISGEKEKLQGKVTENKWKILGNNTNNH